MSQRTLNILAVSDKVLETHYTANVTNLYPKIDLLIGCGDLPYYYLDFLASALDRRMAYVLGNHDEGRQYSSELGELTEVRGGLNIHRRSVMEKGVLLAGLQLSMRYRPNRRLQYSEAEMRVEAIRMFPRLLFNRVRYGRFMDIFVTHSPPFGIHDEPDLTHIGFKFFLTMLRVFKPRYMLHGHIHRHNNIHNTQTSTYHQTTIINVYPRYLLKFPLPDHQLIINK